MLKITALTSALGLLLFSGTLRADAFNQTYSGTLAGTTTVLQESFSLSSASNLNAFTTSYGGGSNLDGTTTAAGGLQPSLTLYTGSGSYVASQVLTFPGAKVDPATGFALDAQLTQNNLAAGSYILVLTNWLEQQPPTATNLSDGFVNYGGSTFTDAGGALRTGAYGLNLAVSPAATAATPEPASLLLMPFGFLAAYWLRKRLVNKTEE